VGIYVIYKNLPLITYVLVLEADVFLSINDRSSLEPVVGVQTGLTDVEEVCPHDHVQALAYSPLDQSAEQVLGHRWVYGVGVRPTDEVIVVVE